MNTVKEHTDRITESIEHRTKESTRLCSRLIQAKSENPPGDTTESAILVEDFLNAEGIGYQKFEPAKGHVNVVAKLGRGTPTLILCGHMDVVPAGDVSNWKMNPFGGVCDKDKIWGRGATDQKGGVAAMLTAMAALRDFEEELNSTVTIACVSDEEAPGPGGARWLLNNKKLSGDTCIITEFTGNIDAKYSVVCGERGTCWLRITAHGRPAHGSNPALGNNAIDRLTDFLPKLRVLEDAQVRIPKDAETLVRNGKKQLNKTAQKQGVPPHCLTRALDHYTVNVGIINGGTKINMVPEECTAEVDIRVPAGGSPDALEEFVRCALPEECEFEVVNKTAPSFTRADASLTMAVQRSAKRVLGYRPSAGYVAYTSDAHYFREVLGVPTVTFGPGYSELAHGHNEYVQIRDVLDMAKVYLNLMIGFSGSAFEA